MKYQRNINALEKMNIDWMGFIFYPRSPRYVRHPLRFTNSGIKRIGVFVDATQDFIQKKIEKYQLSGIQLHGNETPKECLKFKEQDLLIIKAFSIDKNFDFSDTMSYEKMCHYFLFDTKGNVPGGTGQTFSWPLLEKYHGKTPFVLSGGIGLDQIKMIKEFAHPKMAGVDVNSKFETKPGLKNISALKKFKDEFFS